MQPIEEPALRAELIRARADALMARLHAAAEEAGHAGRGIGLVAVTKGFDSSVVQAAVDAGLSTLGENRVREAAPKVEAFSTVDWHLVGRLQSNKVRAALRMFGTIHSVDSLELLQRLDRIAAEEGLQARLLLQVNASEEANKAGFDPRSFAALASARSPLARALDGLQAVTVIGLMTMARLGAEVDEQRATFARLRGLRDALRHSTGLGLPELSMGMTADAEAAVAEGATLVRIGTALFGPRPGH